MFRRMTQLHKYPFVRLVLPFAGGIWIAMRFDFHISVYYLGISLMVLFLASWLIALKLKSYPLRWVFGFLLTIMLIIAGITQVEIRKPWRSKQHFMHLEKPPSYFIARITEPPQQRSKSTRLQLTVEGIITEKDEQKPASGKVIAYLPVNTVGLKYGDLLLFNKKPDSVAPPLNPHQFDYRSYLARSGILHQVFLKEGSWKPLGKGYSNPLFKLAYSMRDYLLDVLKKAGLDGDEFHVASAILLGYDDHLPSYLRQSYTAAGGMHVLCVSGLHVGIVYWFFSVIMVFPGRNKRAKIVKAVILLLILWFYALLTGLSPSVIRASTMFSFMLVGRTFHKKGYIINTLAASALFLLWFEPQALFHIGFQLSYAAVIGIVLLQRPIYSLIYSRFWIVNKAWEATSVAIAAQLATTPFILHYFGQFPSYFVISNLVLAPLSFIVIVTGMVLLLTSFIPFLAVYIGWALSGMIFIMNYLITSIESLPYAVLQPLYLPAIAASTLTVFIIILFILPVEGWKRVLLPALATISLFIIALTTTHIRQLQQSKLIIYAIPQHTVIDFVYGKSHTVIADSAAISDSFVVDFFLKRNWMVSGISANQKIILSNEDHRASNFYKKGPYLEFNQKRLAIWKTEKGKYNVPSEKIKVHFLLIAGNTPEQLNRLTDYYDFDQVVFDLTVPSWQLEKWKATLDTLGKPYHDIKTQGAFVINM